MTRAASAGEASLGLAWLSTFGCSPLLQQLGRHPPEEIWTASRSRLAGWGLTRAAVDRFDERRRGFAAADATEQVERAGLRFIPYDRQDYPAGLRHLSLPPAGIFVRAGRFAATALSGTPRVVIVGTRRPTPYGLLLAQSFAAAFAREGVTVLSGMALGIDGASHQGALEAGGGTVAILGCGADVVYPRSHRKLYAAITEHGAAISELPPGAAPTRWAFPLRNRLLAALGDAVLVIEAGLASGALQTADWALTLGRPVFSVPGPITGDNHRGTNRLIYEGAFPALDPVVTVQDFLLLTRIERGGRHPATAITAPDPVGDRLFLSPARPGKDGMNGGFGEATPAETKVLGCLSRGASAVDALVQSTGLSVREVSAALARLQLKGIVTRAGPGLFIRAP